MWEVTLIESGIEMDTVDVQGQPQEGDECSLEWHGDYRYKIKEVLKSDSESQTATVEIEWL